MRNASATSLFLERSQEIEQTPGQSIQTACALPTSSRRTELKGAVMLQHRFIYLVLAWLLVPAGAMAQSTEEHDTEVIRPPRIKSSSNAKKPDLARVAKLIIDRTNAFRKEQGRPQVEVDARLARAAQYFADYMAKNDRYGHGADGQRPADRARKHGYDYCIVLENIAYDYNSAGFSTDELGKALVEGWKHSPGHRRNMLDPDVNDTAVAVAHSDKTGYYYAVQMFGRPHSKAIEFTIANQSDARIEYRIGKQSFPLPPSYVRTHTRCRPAKVVIQLLGSEPGSKGESRTVQPASGDHFVITGDSRGYQVKKE
jgi:uncharacterized protein YkwD